MTWLYVVGAAAVAAASLILRKLRLAYQQRRWEIQARARLRKRYAQLDEFDE